MAHNSAPGIGSRWRPVTAPQLRGMGVRWGQGYHFGRPEPIAARLLPAAVAPAAAVQ